MAIYYITDEYCVAVEGSTEHADFACACLEALTLSRDLEKHLYVLHENGRHGWEVNPLGAIVKLPEEPFAAWTLNKKQEN